MAPQLRVVCARCSLPLLYFDGVLMSTFSTMQLLTQQTPWAEELKATSQLEFLRELEEALFAGRRPTVPRWCEAAEFAPYVALMQQCWATEPDKRPAFNTVASLLANMAHSEGQSAEATF